MAGHLGTQGSGKKEKLDLKALGKLIVYSKRYLPFIILALILAIGGAVCTIIGPDIIKDLTGSITSGIFLPGGVNMDDVIRYGVTLIIIYAVGLILSYAQNFIMGTITQYTSKRLRTDISRKINALPLNYFDTTTKGDILSVVSNDVDTISQTLSMSMADLISSIALFVGVIVMMFKNDWALALITIGVSMLGFVASAIIATKSQKFFNKKQQDLGKMNGHIEDVYTNHKIVSVFGGRKKETEVFEHINDDLFADNWKSQILSGMMLHSMTFVSNISNILIFTVGISMYNTNVNALGIIMSFIIYARLFSQPLSSFAQSMSSFQQASAASKRVFNLLEQDELIDESNKTIVLENIKGDVIFDNVHFGYSKEKEIIHGFNANIKRGQKIAIVGPTGAGKTTIVNLLMRFYEIDSGDIKIDGTSIKDITRENVHDLFDMILQDTWLFEGTIKENLIFNCQNISDEVVNKAIEAVGLSHFISTLPEGIDTKLSDSLNLSEGQKQQLTIARAMVKDSPLLILDEATSSVDTRTEIIIQNAMDELTKGRTSFIIAHRLSTIKNADVILVVNNGDIIEQGNHESLLKKKGFYADIYNSQFVTM